MSYADPDYTDPPEESVALREARAAADRNAAEAKEAGKLRRKLALIEVIGSERMTSPLGQMFADAYDGPLDNPEVIKTQALAVGLLSPPSEPEPPAPPAPPTSEDAALQAEREALQTQGITAIPDPLEAERALHPFDTGLAAFHGATRDGATRADASAEFFDRVIDAAVRGDERVLSTRKGDE